jgi:predicted GIY-YIG superfamily endonuclease
MAEKSWACYCLLSSDGATYIGSTVDIQRRLRQHNREIQGGARATGRRTGWKRVCHVLGFPNGRSALQFEWAWKHISRKSSGKTPLERRCNALVELCNQEMATSQATPFAEMPGPLVIFVEDPLVESFLKEKEIRYACMILNEV